MFPREKTVFFDLVSFQQLPLPRVEILMSTIPPIPAVFACPLSSQYMVRPDDFAEVNEHARSHRTWLMLDGGQPPRIYKTLEQLHS